MQSKLGTQGGIKLVAVDNIRMKICRENILKKGVKIMPGINLKPFEHYLKSHAIDVDQEDFNSQSINDQNQRIKDDQNKQKYYKEFFSMLLENGYQIEGKSEDFRHKISSINMINQSSEQIQA